MSANKSFVGKHHRQLTQRSPTAAEHGVKGVFQSRVSDGGEIEQGSAGGCDGDALDQADLFQECFPSTVQSQMPWGMAGEIACDG